MGPQRECQSINHSQDASIQEVSATTPKGIQKVLFAFGNFLSHLWDSVRVKVLFGVPLRRQFRSKKNAFLRRAQRSRREILIHSEVPSLDRSSRRDGRERGWRAMQRTAARC